MRVTEGKSWMEGMKQIHTFGGVQEIISPLKEGMVRGSGGRTHCPDVHFKEVYYFVCHGEHFS